MNDIMKIFKSLEESGLLIKGVSETIKNEANEQKGAFISMLLYTLVASFLGNLLNVKAQSEQVKWQLDQAKIFSSALTLQKYYQNEPKLNGVYSVINLPKIKERAYMINLDEFKSIGTH